MMAISFSVSIFLLSSSILFSPSFSFSFSFSPADNYLVDCGSAVDSVVDNRRFVSDRSFGFSSSASVSPLAETPALGQPQIYQSARVFKAPSKYMFNVQDPGTHIIRIHLHRFNSSNFDLGEAQFHLLIDKVVALSEFGGASLSVSPRILEYLMWVDKGKLDITFVPASKSKFAFVNAIEVISAPKDLILDAAQLVGNEKIGNLGPLTRHALEVVYRVNVGGPKVTPFNDTLWRTWVPDDEYLESSDGSKSTVYFSGRINYKPGGASREAGPDYVYKTARVIRSMNASVPNSNLTWKFPVTVGYKYLIRMHFCDIASISLGLLYFNVYVDEQLAYNDLDLSSVTGYTLAAPFYADFVVDANPSGILSVSVGSSKSSLAYAIDGILNGLEIMKLNNSMGSLSEGFNMAMVVRCWPGGSVNMLFTLVAFVCLVLSVGMMLRRVKIPGSFGSVSWSRLPVDVPEVHLKAWKQPLKAVV